MKIYLKTYVLFVLISILSLFAVGSLYFLYTQALFAVTKNFEYKLAGIGKTVSSVVKLEEAKGVLNIEAEDVSKSALYTKYHNPLREIIKEADASYLYIFHYGGEEDILYLIDGEDFNSDSWAAPSSTEESVQEDLFKGLYNAFREEDGISPLFYEPDLGYMISGTYPILDGDKKRSFYMTGVDITLNEIVQTLTSLATKSILLFVAILIVMIFLARIFSDRISKNVIKVKNETLKLSAIENHVLDTKGTPKELLNIVKQITQYASQSTNNLNKMKTKRADILDKKLSLQLKDLFKDNTDFDSKDNSSDSYYSAFSFKDKIYAYSFKKSGDKNDDILKNYAIKNTLKEEENAPSLLGSLLESCSIFDSNKEVIYSKNNDISITKDTNKISVCFKDNFELFSL